jgi:Spy/CpxP family protein refolding chaperone
MKRLGNRVGTFMGRLFGICVLASAMPLLAQSVTTAPAVRPQADEAAVKARSEAAERAESLRQRERSAAEYQKTVSLPLLQNSWSTNVQWNTGRTNDPLATLQVAPGTWWNNADAATRIGLTKEQQKKMDDIFQQFRLKLIDLNAALSKEELILDPLIASDKLDEVKILAQIDRIALARAELEKANSRMLLGIRQSLTMEQWSKIQASPVTYRLTSPKK